MINLKPILLTGCTASGKSHLAKELAALSPSLIINADALQVYKCWKIISARPSQQDMNDFNHALYGHIDCNDNYDVASWLDELKIQLDYAKVRGLKPIIVGGTGLYFNTITKGISKIPNIDKMTRNKVRSLFKKLGHNNFYEKLLNIDPKVKNRILPTDSQRTQRAYEVILKTKKSLFDWTMNTKSDFINCEIKKVFVDIPREELLRKISQRTESMFKNKCIEEVKKFNSFKLNTSLSANKLIGVQEINSYLKGSISLDQCKELINIKTRQYAKRQNTWARGHMKNWNKLYSKDFSILLKKTLKVIS